MICCWWEQGAVNFCEPVKLIPQQFSVHIIWAGLCCAVRCDCSASLYRTKLVTGKWDRNRGFFLVVLKFLHFSKAQSESWVTQEHKARWALVLNICIVKKQVLPVIVELDSCVFFYFLCMFYKQIYKQILCWLWGSFQITFCFITKDMV